MNGLGFVIIEAAFIVGGIVILFRMGKKFAKASEQISELQKEISLHKQEAEESSRRVRERLIAATDSITSNADRLAQTISKNLSLLEKRLGQRRDSEPPWLAHQSLQMLLREDWNIYSGGTSGPRKRIRSTINTATIIATQSFFVAKFLVQEETPRVPKLTSLNRFEKSTSPLLNRRIHYSENENLYTVEQAVH